MTELEKRLIFEMVMGFEVETGEIENLFAEGSECGRLWDEIYQCEMSIIEKLGGKDCPELEKIWSANHEICRRVSLRMFDYGMEFAGKNK